MMERQELTALIDACDNGLRLHGNESAQILREYLELLDRYEELHEQYQIESEALEQASANAVAWSNKYHALVASRN